MPTLRLPISPSTAMKGYPIFEYAPSGYPRSYERGRGMMPTALLGNGPGRQASDITAADVEAQMAASGYNIYAAPTYTFETEAQAIDTALSEIWGQVWGANPSMVKARLSQATFDSIRDLALTRAQAKWIAVPTPRYERPGYER